MGIIIPGITLPISKDENQAIENAAKLCGIPFSSAKGARIYRRSIDARRGDVKFVWSVYFGSLPDEDKILNSAAGAKRCTPSSLSKLLDGAKPVKPSCRPAVIGFGPAGIFAALTLARLGLRPIVLERGAEISRRDADVAEFKAKGRLDTESNIQFGEGGAGAYSDGKLTTRINDPLCDAVLAELCAHGAQSDILIDAKPHIGTDRLKEVVASMRKEITALGGEVKFGARVTGFGVKNGRLESLKLGSGELQCDAAIAAVGHSARDTVSAISEAGAEVLAKSFAMGVRIEHTQREIDEAVYGRYAGDPRLGPASYSVSRRFGESGCFSFCMCPGGEVLASSSDAGGVVTNGGSNSARSGKNGNSALAVSVAPPDSSDPFSGSKLQLELEQKAYDLGGGGYAAPIERAESFAGGLKRRGMVEPTYPLGVKETSLRELLPAAMCDMLAASIKSFASRYSFFGNGAAILTAPETRTSSPVRISRGEDMQSSVRGLYPCGEGAGYAGGIMSAAVDGIKSALALAGVAVAGDK